jgi:hypothetical protein
VPQSSDLLPEIQGATGTSLTLPDDLSFEDWHDIGVQLRRTASRITWLLGDWWAFGERQRYGERTAFVDAEDWEGPGFGACANAATVCRAFETSRRRETLSFSHHAEVAGLPPEEADKLLDWCLENNRVRRSTRELRQRVRQVQAEKAEKAVQRFVDATYDIAAQRSVVSMPVHDIEPSGPSVIRLVPEPSAPDPECLPRPAAPSVAAPSRATLDPSAGGGPVPPELASLKLEPTPGPELDRVAIIKAAYAELTSQEQFDIVSDLATELGYALTPLFPITETSRA